MSFIFIPHGTVHGFKNISDKLSKMLILFVPGGFEGFFQEMGVPAVEGQGPPPPSQYDKDVEKAGHSFSKYGVELADGVRRSG